MTALEVPVEYLMYNNLNAVYCPLPLVTCVEKAFQFCENLVLVIKSFGKLYKKII